MSDANNGQVDTHANCGSAVMPSRFTAEGWGVCGCCNKPRRLYERRPQRIAGRQRVILWWGLIKRVFRSGRRKTG